MPLIIVDCEAPMGVGAPSVGDMTEIGAVEFIKEPPFHGRTFHGYTLESKRECKSPICYMINNSCTYGSLSEIFIALDAWVTQWKERPIFVSDNPAYDFQWTNFYFWKHLGHNPFGHSGRRISDFYAGLVGDFHNTQQWKQLRITKHDHHPVHDAIGNCEAFGRLLKGER